ncbi:MAG: type IIL restriction-modification enzyme MmeI [Pseudomonadales bacterium]
MNESFSPVESFITRWRGADGSELANAQSFTRELCELLGVPVPDPAQADTRDNAYVFERRVIFNNADGSTAEGRIDCYRRGAFVLENKKLKQGEHTQGFGVALLKAHKQAEQYARALPAGEGRPPFLLVVDVGNLIDVYAEFSRSGATYTPFPDPRSHRIKLDDLRDEKIRERLRTIWCDPLSLDPTRQSAKVTREIAAQLAGIAKALESANYGAERVAGFLTRCLFTFFAEDVGLLPKRSFTELLESLANAPQQFVPLVTDLWKTMDGGGFAVSLRADVLRFNGKLFKQQDVLPLDRDQIALLIEAGRKDWSQVEPAIFGTLLERALDPTERHALGAHYTPRAYVERLVLPTVIEPLREEWSTAQTAALMLASEGKTKEAENVLREFQHRLCNVRVLDPACGSGNFLYVTLEHLKRLEGEVLNQLHDLNVSMSLETEGLTVDPHQFLGIELNPRAASIAEMVLWIGYLQWHFKTNGNAQPPQPVLRDFHNIENRDAVLAYDGIELLRDEKGVPVSRWDGKTFKQHPVTGEDVPDETARITIEQYINPRKDEWPQADFVVGNPPFIGASRMINALGEGYVEALRKTWKEVPDSSDLVMFWWSHAADLLCSKQLQRFGFITTNSLKQTFNRRVLENHMNSKQPLSLVFAIPDHPWVDNADGAAVRISMTVAEAGQKVGKLLTVDAEKDVGQDEPELSISATKGSLHADLRVGANVASAVMLLSNQNLTSRGYMLFGSGFILTPEEESFLAKREGLNGRHPLVYSYRNGRDLTDKSRGAMVIDAFGFSVDNLRLQYPAAYQWLLERVKPERDANKDKAIRENWWVFGRTRTELRGYCEGLSRYVATVETAKHRTFQFLDESIAPDNMLVCIAISDAFHLGVLSSNIHVTWALAAGGRLGVGNDPRYNKSRCFEPFPFPAATEEQKARIRELAEQLDAHRKKQQAQHPELTLTGMYNVLEKLKSGDALTAKEKTIHEQGLVSVLKQLHDELDLAVLDAYGWNDLAELMQVVNGVTPSALRATPPTSQGEINPPLCNRGGAASAAEGSLRIDIKRELDEVLLERLVALNAERVEEEQRGIVRWLRPEYQNKSAQNTQGQAAAQTIAVQTTLDVEPEVSEPIVAAVEKQPWPKADIEQVKAVIDVLAASKTPMDLDAIAANFTGKGQWKKRLPSILEMLVVVGKVRVEDGKFCGM